MPAVKPLQTRVFAAQETDQDLHLSAHSGGQRLHCMAISSGSNGPPEASCSHVVCCMQDTFLDLDHLKESFPGHEFELVNKSGQDTHHRPFRVTFPRPAKQAVPTRKVRSSCMLPARMSVSSTSQDMACQHRCRRMSSNRHEHGSSCR